MFNNRDNEVTCHEAIGDLSR